MSVLVREERQTGWFALCWMNMLLLHFFFQGQTLLSEAKGGLVEEYAV
jgi:hypothetical protein